MLVKKEKIFDNIVAVSGTKKEAIRTISRLCAKQTMLDATQLEKAGGFAELDRQLVTEFVFQRRVNQNQIIIFQYVFWLYTFHFQSLHKRN